MLKSIDPALNADVLYALRAMGHGDDVIICDTNFPADSVARQTVLGKLLRIDNVTDKRALTSAQRVRVNATQNNPVTGTVIQPRTAMLAWR